MDIITSWMEHQAKLNEKYMVVANAPVPATENTNIKVPVYFKTATQETYR